MKKTRIILLVTTIVLLIGAIIGITASATESTPTPEIIGKNIRYGADLKLCIAVDGDALGAGKEVIVNFYDADPATGATPVDTATATYTDTSDKSKYNLDSDNTYIAVSNYGISAIAYGQTFYITAECDGEVSEVLEYSAVEYFLERLYADADEITDIQKEHYENAIAYGSTAQKVVDIDTGTNVADFLWVAAENGTVNGAASAIVVKGAALDFVYTGTDEDDSAVACWKDPDGKTLGSEVATVSGTYAAKFADVSFNDGTVGGKITFNSIANATVTYPNRTEGNDTNKVLAIDATGYNDIRFDVPTTGETDANCYVFEVDMNIDGTISGNNGLQWYLGVSDDKICANFDMRIKDGAVQMIDYHTEGGSNPKNVRDDGEKYTTLANTGEWFTFRVEYYFTGNREDVRLKYYVNNELVLCTNNYFWSNVIEVTDDGVEDTYYAPLTSVDRAMRFLITSSATAGSLKFDNYSFDLVNKVCADDPLTYVTQD